MNDKKEEKTIWHPGTIAPTEKQQSLRDICCDTDNDILVTVGDNGAIYRKTSEGKWEQCKSGFDKESHIYGVATNFSGIFVAGGRGGFIVQSTNNGLSWATKRAKNGEGDITKIAFGNDLFLAILDKGKSPGGILYSTDGVFWNDSQFAIPNATSIKFFNGTFFIGAKNGTIYYGSGTTPWNKCNWENGDVKFEAARALAYNPNTGTYFAAGHQVAISQNGETWSAALDLKIYKKKEEEKTKNIHAIVPVEGKTYLFGEDMLILEYDGTKFTQVELSHGTTLGACLLPDRIICVGIYGKEVDNKKFYYRDRYILLSDLKAAG